MNWLGSKSLQNRGRKIFTFLAGPLLKWIALALIILGAVFMIYSRGQKSIQVKWDAERQATAIIAARADAVNKERQRIMEKQVEEADRRAHEAVKSNSARSNTERSRLRESYARGRGVPSSTATPINCNATSIPSRDELLGWSEAVVELAERASADRIALEACVSAWPK